MQSDVVGVLWVPKQKVTADITHSRMVCMSNSPTTMVVEALYKSSTVENEFPAITHC